MPPSCTPRTSTTSSRHGSRTANWRSTGKTKSSLARCCARMASPFIQPSNKFLEKPDGRPARLIHLHARRLHRLRDHRQSAGHPAHAADVRFQLHPRRRRRRRHAHARHRRHRRATGHRLLRRRPRRGQCRRWLRRHRAHARHVQEKGSLSMTLPIYVQGAWFVGALLFILGLKGMSSPASARKGIVWAGYGMLVAIAGTFLVPGLQNLALMSLALGLGASAAWISGQRVKMTDMPQMVAIYNGMGGGAAAAIAAIEFAKGDVHSPVATTLAVLGALIGSVSFTGSCVAYAKLQGLMKKAYRLPAQNVVNVVLALSAAMIALAPANPELIYIFFAVALVLGLIVTLPIGGADMPVVISLFNAFTGLAVGFEGYVLGNPALIIAGIVVGAAGTLLTQLMAKAMNRPLTNILFTPMVASGPGEAISGSMKEVGAIDAAAMMRYASKVIIVPGYGMAVAHAQHKVWEMSELLEEAGVEVKFA